MTPSSDKRKMTDSQRRAAYRAAVEACLEEFYGEPQASAHALVLEWWKRLAATSAYRSGLFLHPEPINTAARLANKEPIEINVENESAYKLILDRARAASLNLAEQKTIGALAKPVGSTRMTKSKQLATANS